MNAVKLGEGVLAPATRTLDRVFDMASRLRSDRVASRAAPRTGDRMNCGHYELGTA